MYNLKVICPSQVIFTRDVEVLEKKRRDIAEKVVWMIVAMNAALR